MRTRTFLALLAAAAVMAIGLPSVASAAAPEGGHETIEVAASPKETNHELFHCATEVVEGQKTIEDCQQAPSPIMPATNELIWGGIAFLLLFLALWKFAFPGIRKGMEGRAERIRSDLEAAETAKAESTGVLAEYNRQLAEARSEAHRIIEESRVTADALRRDLQAKAEADIAELRQRAAAEVESQKAQALADLRGEVTELALGAAETVVQRNLDRATNEALVEQFITQVGAGRS